MLNYENLVNDVCIQFSEVEKLYNEELNNDTLDLESGVHTVFSFCFVPILKKAIFNKNEILIKEMFDYLEEMEKSNDNHVGEVAEFTVLEELLDEISFDSIEKYMGKYTRQAAALINRYIKVD